MFLFFGYTSSKVHKNSIYTQDRDVTTQILRHSFITLQHNSYIYRQYFL